MFRQAFLTIPKHLQTRHYSIEPEITMNKFATATLAFCLAASAHFAFAQDAMSMGKDSMGKDSMDMKDQINRNQPM
jgi:hypothetical protein